MSEGKRTVTVQVHEGSEKPTAGLVYAYMETPEGWELVEWTRNEWFTLNTSWPIEQPGPWVELKDIAQAVEGGQDVT